MTSAPAAPSSRDDGDRRRHPLEDSDRLAWQATAAVGLLERFGAQLTVALDAVGRSDDDALGAALLERDQLVTQLEPLLASLAEARVAISEWPGPGRGRGESAAQQAITLILAPVDEALEHAQHLHRRLADETRDAVVRRTRSAAGTRRAVALVR